RRGICGSCAYCCPKRSVLASYPSDESSVTIRVDEFDRLSTAKCCSHFGRGHLAKQEQELSVAEWLAGQRMLSSGLDDVRDISVGETHRVRLVGDHCSEERIDSGHTHRTTQFSPRKTRTALPGTGKTATAVPGARTTGKSVPG